MNKIEKIKMQIELFNESYPKLSKKSTLNQDGAAKFIGCSPNTLKDYRKKSIGPSYSRPGKKDSRVYYTKVELAAWLIESAILTM